MIAEAVPAVASSPQFAARPEFGAATLSTIGAPSPRAAVIKTRTVSFSADPRMRHSKIGQPLSRRFFYL
jgi:hypothetical protein